MFGPNAASVIMSGVHLTHTLMYKAICRLEYNPWMVEEEFLGRDDASE